MKTPHSFSALARIILFFLIGFSLQTLVACQKEPDIKPQLVHVNHEVPKPIILDTLSENPKVGLPVVTPKPGQVTTL